ncbi:hypothetical protein BC940DRAFT_121669 [Gongronella butleri]|nr:hypothetical protein BC940DRAFT_121669 [Gongronella butleri]
MQRCTSRLSTNKINMTHPFFVPFFFSSFHSTALFCVPPFFFFLLPRFPLIFYLHTHAHTPQVDFLHARVPSLPTFPAHTSKQGSNNHDQAARQKPTRAFTLSHSRLKLAKKPYFFHFAPRPRRHAQSSDIPFFFFPLFVPCLGSLFFFSLSLSLLSLSLSLFKWVQSIASRCRPKTSVLAP